MVTKVHEEACFALENIGIEINEKRKDKETLQPFLEKAKNMVLCSSERIYFTRELIDWALEKTPKRSQFPVPEGSWGGGGTASWVYNHEKNIWELPDVNTHVREIMQIAEEYKIPFMFRGVGPQHNAYEDTKQIEVMREHYSGFCYFYVATDEGVAACKKEYRRNPNMATTHSIMNSPLRMNNVGPNWPVFYRCVEEKLPIYLVTMPQLFVNGPGTVYGMVLVSHIEFLAGLCITQVLQPGLMTIHAGFPQGTNPLDGYNTDHGSIIHNEININLADVATYLDLPAIQDGCSTSGAVDEFEIMSSETKSETIRGYKMWNGARKRRWHQCRHFVGFDNYQILYSIPRMQNDFQAWKTVIKNNLTHNIADMKYDPEMLMVDDDFSQSVLYQCIHSYGGNFMNMNHTLKHQHIII